jgi:hypothetical protein
MLIIHGYDLLCRRHKSEPLPSAGEYGRAFVGLLLLMLMMLLLLLVLLLTLLWRCCVVADAVTCCCR